MKQCAFAGALRLHPAGSPIGLAVSLRSALGYRIDTKGTLAWTDKAQHRFKERLREITSRNRGHKVQVVIGELDQYIRGWIN